MSNFNLEKLDDAKREIDSATPAELSQSFVANYQELRQEYNKEAIGFCLDKFITAELDFVAPAKRGLGRSTDGPLTVPRWGACFRKQMARLNREDIISLYDSIQNLMLQSYIVHALLLGKPKGIPLIQNGTVLYESWIPSIYVELAGDFLNNQEATQTVFSLVDPGFGRLGACLEKLSSAGKFGTRKVKRITYYYVVAGFGLRRLETNPTYFNLIHDAYPHYKRGKILDIIFQSYQARSTSQDIPLEVVTESIYRMAATDDFRRPIEDVAETYLKQQHSIP